MPFDVFTLEYEPQNQIVSDGKILVERDGPQNIGRFQGDDQLRYTWLRDMIVAHAPNRRVLDAGCNIGEILRLLLTDGVIAPGDAYGLDIDPTYVEVAGDYVDGATFFCGAMEYATARTGLRDLGAVIASEVIEHVHDPRAAIAALVETLAAGGVLLLTTPEDNPWAHDYARAHPHKHRHVFGAAALTALVNSAGLRVLAVSYTLERYDGLQMLLLAAQKEGDNE